MMSKSISDNYGLRKLFGVKRFGYKQAISINNIPYSTIAKLCSYFHILSDVENESYVKNGY